MLLNVQECLQDFSKNKLKMVPAMVQLKFYQFLKSAVLLSWPFLTIPYGYSSKDLPWKSGMEPSLNYPDQIMPSILKKPCSFWVWNQFLTDLRCQPWGIPLQLHFLEASGSSIQLDLLHPVQAVSVSYFALLNCYMLFCCNHARSSTYQVGLIVEQI